MHPAAGERLSELGPVAALAALEFDVLVDGGSAALLAPEPRRRWILIRRWNGALEARESSGLRRDAGQPAAGRTREVMPVIDTIHRTGATALRAITAALEARRVRTPRGVDGDDGEAGDRPQRRGVSADVRRAAAGGAPGAAAELMRPMKAPVGYVEIERALMMLEREEGAPWIVAKLCPVEHPAAREATGLLLAGERGKARLVLERALLALAGAPDGRSLNWFKPMIEPIRREVAAQ